MGTPTGDDIAPGSRRISQASLSSRSWRSIGVGEVFSTPGHDFFRTSGRQYDDQEELIWAAIERLPTYDRTRKGMLKKVFDDGKVVHEEVDFANMGNMEKKQLRENLFKAVEEDNEIFLKLIRKRTDRVGIDMPKVEIRYEHLSIEGDAYVGSRALPTLFNSALNMIEGILQILKIIPSRKKHIRILRDVNGIVKPSRITLLLGPPGSGKTTLLKALAGRLDDELKVSGRITYCGHELSEFIPQRTCSYIGQHDLHHTEMTVRESLDFSRRCLGVGSRYELLAELSRREKETRIKPDPEIDAFMKAISVEGQEASLATDYTIKLLGLDICADVPVGDEMKRGISGGQKKRLTTGEMLVGPAKVFFMDEISTGLDSSTTFQIVTYMRQMVHIMDVTMVISLLQPAPETFELFDDIILLSEGQVVYHGPRENVLEFFDTVGFKCPERKGVADFLQEVTSSKDQEQYWFRHDKAYRYVSVTEFAEHFASFHIGQKLAVELAVPYDKSKTHPAALVTTKYGILNSELFKACFSKEWLLMKHNSFVHIFKTFQMTILSIITSSLFLRTDMKSGDIVDGGKFYGALFFGLFAMVFSGRTEAAMMVARLPVFFKQRDALLYPAWAFSLSFWLLRIPLSLVDSLIWVGVTYYTIGFAPEASRFLCQILAFFAINQMALSMYRFIASLGRTEVVSNTFGTFAVILVFLLGGYIIARDDIEPWMIWGYYISPVMYAQNALSINEFLGKRWSSPNTDPSFSEPTVGKVLLKARGMYSEEYVYWICISALFAFSILFNIGFTIALTFLNPFRDSRSILVAQDAKRENINLPSAQSAASDLTTIQRINSEVIPTAQRGMVLPFTPLSLAFDNVNYYIDIPSEMKNEIQENRLQLLRNVSGAFRPGILTALVGVSGAGKTTLMDVLAGRKTSGYIEGTISISGYPKNQSTFARISGYCEQTDIHSPHVTVYESIIYSAFLRLPPEVNNETRKIFVEEVMELIELNPLRDSLVGLPGVDGLSTEQRKRLTIAVELVANPSIIFMDEPTSGLDARAAAIVMRTVRNTVDTGRTVVCTIHQPSIDIFDAFNELLLMKRGGQVIYAGPIGHRSNLLIEYFQSVPGVPMIKEGSNPATWMLDISTPAMEAKLDLDFAEIYAKSQLYRTNQNIIKQLSTPMSGSKDLYFSTKYAQSFIAQYKACFWKQHLSYWRQPQYNSKRFFMTAIIGIIFGIIFWQKGHKISKQQDLQNLLGAMYSAVLLLGGTNSYTVQSVVSVERTVFYREKAAGMYSALPYAFAQVAIETIYTGIQTLLYTLILYPMIGFEWKADKFFLFYFFVCMSFVYFTSYGMMLVSITPSYQLALIVMMFFLSFWNLFCGFVIPRKEMPIWWRWYYWLSPVAWTINGLISSQLGDKMTLVEVPGLGSITVKEYLDRFLGFKYDFIGVAAAAHVGWVVLFFLVFAFGIKYLNFQRR